MIAFRLALVFSFCLCCQFCPVFSDMVVTVFSTFSFLCDSLLSQTYTGPESLSELCRYHPGEAIFHEG